VKKETLIKCALVGGLVVFLWGAFSWMVLPWHSATMMRFQDESEVAETIEDNTAMSGVYVLPNMCAAKAMQDSDAQAEGAKMMKEGPMMFCSVMKGGMQKSMVQMLITGFIIQVVAALIATWLLMHTKGLTFWKQVCFVTSMGLFAGVVGYLPCWNWWGFTLGYTVVGMLDLIIGWFLAGLVIAKLAKK